MISARAAIADGNGGFSIEAIQVGDPGPNEVLVQIKASGVCHTDWDSLNWGRPIILGHEGAGIVLKTGPGVTRVSEGDEVVLNWAIPCGHCFQCLHGNRHICENQNQVTAGDYMQGHAALESTLYKGEGIERSFNIGTMSTHAVVREEALVKMNPGIPFSSACIIGCGVMTGYGSAVNAAKVTPGSSAVVLGVGGVGLNAIQGCRISGADKIIAIDINEQRLEFAKTFGATHTILADKNDTGLLKAAEKVKAMTDGRGADFAFECTAIPALGAAPLAMIRNAGTACQVSGIEEEITIDMNLFEWDKLYINPLYGSCDPYYDMPKLMNLYDKGALLLDEMITRTYPLEELEQAFHDMHSGENAKGVLILE
ncbi:Zn-dependent alcohol dehydrogenase [Pontiellaceae bacterium B12227]|nr:Zn-dependent alcohol dehydrogenase [Pontiellaceae bacterium B12227]